MGRLSTGQVNALAEGYGELARSLDAFLGRRGLPDDAEARERAARRRRALSELAENLTPELLDVELGKESAHLVPAVEQLAHDVRRLRLHDFALSLCGAGLELAAALLRNEPEQVRNMLYRLGFLPPFHPPEANA
ncbi:hypothetical protein [Desulfohalovibrio reitneri]|uniref:hypothetical protein n=1 Tax=Desulfohalovibrio reitneri TaxID=1307759 RepID=UPI0004A717D6|nr:hypothetical protein [Desulfohalovibrio reitneri]